MLVILTGGGGVVALAVAGQLRVALPPGAAQASGAKAQAPACFGEVTHGAFHGAFHFQVVAGNGQALLPCHRVASGGFAAIADLVIPAFRLFTADDLVHTILNVAGQIQPQGAQCQGAVPGHLVVGIHLHAAAGKVDHAGVGTVVVQGLGPLFLFRGEAENARFKTVAANPAPGQAIEAQGGIDPAQRGIQGKQKIPCPGAGGGHAEAVGVILITGARHQHVVIQGQCPATGFALLLRLRAGLARAHFGESGVPGPGQRRGGVGQGRGSGQSRARQHDDRQ